MKKKILSLCLVLALLCVTVVGTLAYFTDTDEATNVFTMGNVDITLDEADVEKGDDGEYTALDERVQENEYENLYPGQIVPKDPTVHNTGSQDAYIRVTVTLEDLNAAGLLFKDAEGTFPNVDLKAVFGGLDLDKWTVSNNWSFDVMTGKEPFAFTFVLNDVLKAGDDVTLFTSVTLPKTVNNEEAALLNGLTMTITADAIQAAGFENAAKAFEAFDAE